MKLNEGWKEGPLPPKTFMWGGVVRKDGPPSGFYFADFCGDHVKAYIGGQMVRIEPHEVAYYNNSLLLPCFPCSEERSALPPDGSV